MAAARYGQSERLWWLSLFRRLPCELFWVTSATTACGSIALFLIRSTISWSTWAGVARCWDLSCVGDKDVPMDINRLIRHRNELPRPERINDALCVTPHPINEWCRWSAA
jgi:hypothetical protein